MRKYIAKGKKKNKDEWVEGDYLYNDKTKNHLIATEKDDREEKKNIDYGSSYTFWIVDPDTVTLTEVDEK
ncbi:hypothetical protein P7H30_11225 [Streptococcus parauberis]|uniref:hypothetical protein n=1 Tax=Streptococcus parauberis TaxID=1348 RepID=UPI00288D5046|nr:hypothetical protein [Streptococcus parauberis]MDT2750280.1 hypothetical protein [Streptococcus parauberis]